MNTIINTFRAIGYACVAGVTGAIFFKFGGGDMLTAMAAAGIFAVLGGLVGWKRG